MSLHLLNTGTAKDTVTICYPASWDALCFRIQMLSTLCYCSYWKITLLVHLKVSFVVKDFKTFALFLLLYFIKSHQNSDSESTKYFLVMIWCQKGKGFQLFTTKVWCNFLSKIVGHRIHGSLKVPNMPFPSIDTEWIGRYFCTNSNIIPWLTFTGRLN